MQSDMATECYRQQRPQSINPGEKRHTLRAESAKFFLPTTGQCARPSCKCKCKVSTFDFVFDNQVKLSKTKSLDTIAIMPVQTMASAMRGPPFNNRDYSGEFFLKRMHACLRFVAFAKLVCLVFRTNVSFLVFSCLREPLKITNCPCTRNWLSMLMPSFVIERWIRSSLE